MSSEAYNSMHVPTNLSLLKNHEMWFYFLLISHVCFPIVSSTLYHICFAFLPTRHIAINFLYGGDSKAWQYSHEIQQRGQTLQNSGTAITIWDLEKIVRRVCRMFIALAKFGYHNVNL